MGSMLGLPEYMRTLSSYDHILSALGCLCVRDRSRVRMAIDVHGCTEFRFSSCSSLRYVLARRGQTGPHDLLALGASHPHIAVVADIAVDVAAAADVAVADPTSLHETVAASGHTSFSERGGPLRVPQVQKASAQMASSNSERPNSKGVRGTPLA